MKINQTDTSCAAFHTHAESGMWARQREKILSFIEGEQFNKRDWSIGELAHALGMEKSTVSARVNELLYEGDTPLVECPRRRDRRSGIEIRPVGLPVIGQGVLF